LQRRNFRWFIVVTNDSQIDSFFSLRQLKNYRTLFHTYMKYKHTLLYTYLKYSVRLGCTLEVMRLLTNSWAVYRSNIHKKKEVSFRLKKSKIFASCSTRIENINSPFSIRILKQSQIVQNLPNKISL
jgi:hypothetical protein